MAIQLGSAYGKVTLDTKGLRDGVKNGINDLKQLQKAGILLSDTLGNIGRTLTIGLTLPILAMGAASIKAASDFEETKNKAVVVFGDMADSVVANSNRAASTLGLSKTQYLDYASALGAAFTAGGLGIQESAELAEQAVQHFADLASFHNARVEDVAAAWQSAIRGQYEPIQKYFPFITNQFLITYGTANGLIDANTKQLTANQRAIILNAIALNEELNPAVNDFAETSGGLANQTRIMQALLKNALILLGQNLLPIALQVVTALNKMLESFNNLSPASQKILLGFLGFLAVLGPLATGISKIIGLFVSLSALSGTLSGLGISLGGISAALGGVGAILGAIALPLLIVLAVLSVLAAQAAIFYVAWKNNFLGIRDITKNAVSNIKDLLAAFKAFLAGDMEEAQEIIVGMWNRTMEMLQKNFPRAFEFISSGLQRFTMLMRDMLGRIVTFIRDTFARIDWGLIGKYILQGLANGMLLGIPSLLLVAKKVADSLLTQIKKSLGIKSPSAAFAQLGMFSAQGFALGLQRGMNAEELARSIAKPVTNMTNSQQQNITLQFASGLTVQQVRQMIAQDREDLMNSIIGALNG